MSSTSPSSRFISSSETYRKLPVPQAGSSTRVCRACRETPSPARALFSGSFFLQKIGCFGLHAAPVFGQGLDDGRHDQTLDIGARRIMRTQPVALRRAPAPAPAACRRSLGSTFARCVFAACAGSPISSSSSGTLARGTGRR